MSHGTLITHKTLTSSFLLLLLGHVYTPFLYAPTNSYYKNPNELSLLLLMFVGATLKARFARAETLLKDIATAKLVEFIEKI